MARDTARAYRVLFNHDAWCVFMQSSPYQEPDRPVGVAQVLGYVDEVAAAGCDVLLLSPVLARLPLWQSEVFPHWQLERGRGPVPETAQVDRVCNRVRAFVETGQDFIRLTADRARERGLAFFLTWRMNEGHDCRREGSPLQSAFWREHPEYRIGGPGAKSLFGRLLDFSHAPVRDYQFSLLEEVCSKYPPDGLELDFQRFPKFFPRRVGADEGAAILTGFVARVRRMLDRAAGDVPLCVRVPNRPDLVRDIGLDLQACMRRGLIDMVNVAPFLVTQPDAEIEAFRAALPGVRLYGEMTDVTQRAPFRQVGAESGRRTTREIFRSTAHSFLQRGCDGVSLFNFVYTRGLAFGDPTIGRRGLEPPFDALPGITDLARLRGESKHYVLTDERYSRQLPRRLEVDDELSLRLHVADDFADPDVRAGVAGCILRVQMENPSSLELQAFIDDRPLEPAAHEGQLFPQPYPELLPTDPAQYRDFAVPPAALRKGWNVFTLGMISSGAVNITRAELAIYRTGGRAR